MTSPKLYLVYTFSAAARDFRFVGVYSSLADADAHVAQLKEIHSASGWMHETMDEIIERLVKSRLDEVYDFLKIKPRGHV